MADQNDTIYLGLCLAGAVSAGAYTAGAMDYLLEALEEWEKRRGQPDIPTHKVLIPAVGGASAGGMTGIILASSLQHRIEHLQKLDGDIYKEVKNNKFYHTWVDMLDVDMFSRMLDTGDIDTHIPSLLNSKFIDDIALRALDVKGLEVMKRPFFEKNLKVFTTLTNLKGLVYNTEIAGGHEQSAFYFSRHSDFAAFELNAAKNNGNGWIPLDFYKPTNVDIAMDAAMATGAFPVGLQARKLVRNADDINMLSWHRNITDRWKVPSGDYSTLCVDGGVINNEPFYQMNELLQMTVKMQSENGNDPTRKEVESELEKTGNNKKVTADNFRCTTLMIDPFPSEKPDTEIPGHVDDIFSVIGKTLSAILSQVRLKPESLEKIFDKDDPSLFLIAPVRYEIKDGIEVKIAGSKAIACGFLGGFGGFIDKEFRIHDYFLGRANCEKFLREHFTVPATTANPILVNGYKNVDKSRYIKNGRLQIIPIFTEQQGKAYMPNFRNGGNWPVQSQKYIERYRNKIQNRVGKVLMNVGKLKWYQQALLWIGNRVILRSKITSAVMDTIIKDMNKWGLIR